MYTHNGYEGRTGNVTCYNRPDNIYPPATTLITTRQHRMGRQTTLSPWEELGTGLSGELEVPFVKQTTVMELRVSLYDREGKLVAQRTAGYVIRNEFEIMLLHPGPGTEVLPEKEVTLIYSARDADGNAVPGEQVVWTYSTDQVNWKNMAGNTFSAPAEPGRVYLRAEAESFPGVQQQAVYFVDVVETYGTTSINFGKAEGEDYTLGETGQLHATGKYYGFNDDHTDRIETFRTVKPNKGRVCETNIRLKENRRFEYTTGNGVYLVKAVFGPVDNHGHGYHYPHHKYDHNRDRCYGNKEMTAVIEGKEIAIRKWGWNVRVYEVLVTVEDGRLTLTGTEGLPVMQLDVRKLTGEEGVKRKGRPPEGGPPGYGNREWDTGKRWNDDEKGGSE